MPVLNIYLTFNGNCEEAFRYYQGVFGTELSIMRFNEVPPGEDMPPLGEDMAHKIMHASLPVSKETSLMGSDTMEGMGPDFQQGNNFSISIGTESREEAERMFGQLSEGGQVIMPLDKTFWAEQFGMVTDRYGINWLVNQEPQQE